MLLIIKSCSSNIFIRTLDFINYFHFYLFLILINRLLGFSRVVEITIYTLYQIKDTYRKYSVFSVSDYAKNS